jgi:hypothetical protein
MKKLIKMLKNFLRYIASEGFSEQASVFKLEKELKEEHSEINDSFERGFHD